jgi:Uma2 family endonuclease
MDAVTTLPQSRPLTRQDLESVPDDGHRYELIDGALIVTPAPRPRHQTAVLELAIALRDACPAELKVLIAPLDVVLADDTVLQPDVLVTRRADLSERDLPVPPLLAVEVLSPSTRLIDLNLKRARYEAAGCPSYWVIDPDEPSLVAWELRDAAYVEVAHVVGEETFRAARPYGVNVCPAQLVE